MSRDELLDFLRTRRTIRRFKPDPIPDEDITKMIEVARWAPSGANGQPWEFIIVKDPKTIRKIAETYHQIREEHYIIEQTREADLRHHQLRTRFAEPPRFKDAPVFIVVCGDRRTFQASILAGRFIGCEGGLDGTYLKNMGNATYGLQLAATALGLGTQWVSVSAEWEQMLKQILGVPPILQIHTVVPVGYPAYDPPPPYRRDLAEIIHHEKYEMSKFRSGEQVIEFVHTLRGKTKPAYDPEKPNS